jgi:hypothetical protein
MVLTAVIAYFLQLRLLVAVVELMALLEKLAVLVAVLVQIVGQIMVALELQIRVMQVDHLPVAVVKQLTPAVAVVALAP